MKSRDELSITFTAEEGDIIYVAIQASNIPEGSTVGEMILTVTEVAE